MADSRHISLDEVVVHFAKLEDPRSTVNLQHPLVSVVVIALMAVLAGASGPTAIGKWAALKEEFLLNTLDSRSSSVFVSFSMAVAPDTHWAREWIEVSRQADAPGVPLTLP